MCPQEIWLRLARLCMPLRQGLHVLKTAVVRGESRAFFGGMICIASVVSHNITQPIFSCTPPLLPTFSKHPFLSRASVASTSPVDELFGRSCLQHYVGGDFVQVSILLEWRFVLGVSSPRIKKSGVIERHHATGTDCCMYRLTSWHQVPPQPGAGTRKQSTDFLPTLGLCNTYEYRCFAAERPPLSSR